MKNFLYLLLLCSSLSFAQTVPAPQITFGTALTDLKARKANDGVQAIVNGLSTVGDANGGTYMYSTASTATDDGFLVIRPTAISAGNPGRWLRVGNGNTLKNTAVFSGVTLQTTYTVAYGQTLPFVPAMVVIQPRSANAAALSYVSSITNTNFAVTFLTIPVIGTNNITFDYIVIKQ